MNARLPIEITSLSSSLFFLFLSFFFFLTTPRSLFFTLRPLGAIPVNLYFPFQVGRVDGNYTRNGILLGDPLQLSRGGETALADPASRRSRR